MIQDINEFDLEFVNIPSSKKGKRNQGTLTMAFQLFRLEKCLSTLLEEKLSMLEKKHNKKRWQKELTSL